MTSTMAERLSAARELLSRVNRGRPVIERNDDTGVRYVTVEAALDAILEAAALASPPPSAEWKIVPIEPTEEMLKAGREVEPFQTVLGEKPWRPGQIVASCVYRAMLAASPPNSAEPTSAQIFAAQQAHWEAAGQTINAMVVDTMLKAARVAPNSADLWRDIASAPKDGTQILAWCVHDNFQYAKTSEEKARWAAPVIAYWTTFNKGGWVWNGMVGQFTHWQPLPAPPQLEPPAQE